MYQRGVRWRKVNKRSHLKTVGGPPVEGTGAVPEEIEALGNKQAMHMKPLPPLPAVLCGQ
jgi:hypothetical protein